jgi:cyclase
VALIQKSAPVPFALLALAALLATPATAQDDLPAAVEVTHLAGPLHALLCNGRARMVASVGPDGILLVDTGYAGTAAAVQQALANIGSGPVRVIVNTHGDGDHVGGNATLGENALIVAHSDVRRQMGTYFALPNLEPKGLPALALDHEATLHFNGDIIRLLPMPGGHTAGDLVVHFTRSGVACVGDLAFGGTFPNADPARGGNAQRLAEVLRELKKELPPDTTLVPGHRGHLTMTDLQSYIDMIEGTVAAVKEEVEAGRPLDDVQQRRPLARWADWENPENNPSLESWTTEIYASLTGRAPRSICAPMTEALVQADVEAAVATYRRVKAEEPQDWSFAENELNTLGYQLLQRGRVDDAIVVFELNVEVYPEAFNPYDSLGEAYMVAGQKERAIANYERSLELNPDNTSATAALSRLREE